MKIETPPQLTEPVNDELDHVMGKKDAAITIVEYGDYECPHCRMASTVIEDVFTHLGEHKVKYVYRHFPLSKIHSAASLAAEASEAAGSQGKFWEMHNLLFKYQNRLNKEAILELAREINLDLEKFERELDEGVHKDRVQRDFISGAKSGVNGTPTFFINGQRYDGAFDVEAFLEYIQKPLGVRIRLMYQEFARFAAAGGIVLLVFASLALVWANSPFASDYFHLWEMELGIEIGDFKLVEHLLEWVNDGLMTIFFFVVGLEIKREVTVGELASPKKAALPIAAAVGGMVVPVAFYLLFNLAGGPALNGWAIPMATDIAFTIVILTVLGKRIPLSMKVFFTAMAIVDDLGAVTVIALFYSSNLHLEWLLLAVVFFLLLVFYNRTRVYWPLPYWLTGIGLWFAFLEAGLHPTIAGVLLAMTIPTRSAVNTPALLSQCVTLLDEFNISPEKANSRRQAMAKTLENMSERILSPAQRLERDLHPWTTFLVLPVFALANTGVVLSLNAITDLLHPVSLGIIAGLVIGKPLGITLFAYLATRIGIAELPREISWFQFISTSFLAGIGFTMSLLIATAAFADPELINVAKIGILAASLLASVIGFALLIRSSPGYERVSTS
ncbi:MAG: Na+/H+ antiporter NhaA [Candidatus Odinarchaeota archaeon]